MSARQSRHYRARLCLTPDRRAPELTAPFWSGLVVGNRSLAVTHISGYKGIFLSGMSQLDLPLAAQKLSLSELEQYLSKASWILKGPIGASDFKAYIFPMLFFKRISDVYDEEYATALAESGGDEEYAQLPEFHRFVIPEGCHWNNVRETTTNVGLKIETSLREIEQAF